MQIVGSTGLLKAYVTSGKLKVKIYQRQSIKNYVLHQGERLISNTTSFFCLSSKPKVIYSRNVSI